MNSRITGYTVSVWNSIYLTDWVIIRGPQYLVDVDQLASPGEAEYVLGVF
jgi:hypothetical protein